METAERFLDLGLGPRPDGCLGGRDIGRNLTLRFFDLRSFAGARRFQVLPGGLPPHASPIVGSMDPSNARAPETPIFSAIIRPHRSLGRDGFVLLMGLVSAISFVAGMVFLI